MSDPRLSLEKVIQTAIDSALKEVHTCLPAVVTKVSGQTIEAQPTIQRKISGELVNIPLLVDVPLRYQKTSKFSITFPVDIGDHVMIIFSERSIDTWLLSGEIQAPGDIRKHSLSDGFAIPMMYPNTDEVPDFDSTNLQIKTASGSGVTLTPGGDIELNGNSDWAVAYTDLKTAFDQFVTDYNSHTHTSASPGSPTSAPAAPTTADMTNAKVDSVKVP